MATKEIGVCVVGAGDLGRVHMRAWKDAGARLIAVADPDNERAQKAKDDFGAEKTFTDYRQAILEKEVNAVSVCTPTCFHPEVTIFAANAGKNVLCEKPIALTLEKANEMIEACRSKGVKLAIEFSLRASPNFQLLKNALKNEIIGHPIMYVFNAVAEVRPKLLMHDRNANGGPIIDFLCHHFDFFAEMTGSNPVSVTARGYTFAKDKQEVSSIKELARDTAGIIIEYESGDTAVLTISWGVPPKTKGMSSGHIIGPGGIITGDVYSGFQADLGGKIEKIGDKPKIIPQENFVRHFADCLRNNTTPLAGGEEGKRALKVSLAALESIETGKTIKII